LSNFPITRSFGNLALLSARRGDPVPTGIRCYAGALILALALSAGILINRGVGLDGSPWVLAALCLIGLIAERQSVHITSYTQVSVSGLPLLFAAVVYGPLAAALVGACSMLADFGRPHARWVIWTTSRSIVGVCAGLMALIVVSGRPTFTQLLLAVAAAAAVEAAIDTLLATVTAVLRARPWRETVLAMGRVAFATIPLYGVIVAVLAYAYEELSPWTALLFFFPAVAAQRLFVLYQEERRLVTDLASANGRLESANLSFATALVATLDARDRYTAGHSAATAVYARDIAARLGLSDHEQRLTHLAGLVHDIGKIGLPPGLLEKPGPLTLEERRQMEQHSAMGERILRNVEDYEEIATIVRHHHERIDGNGYPDGLKGDAIPLISQILAVADAYNAMTSGRPYRDAMPSRVARLRLAQAVESQFDTTVVAAFEAILAGANESYLSGLSHDFGVEAQRHSSVLAPELAASSA
jgi:putative nucleotidyltransferase with HDIG domain